MDEVRRKLSEMLKDGEPASQPSREEMEPLPPKKKMALLLMVSRSEGEAPSRDKTRDRYNTNTSVHYTTIEACPLQRWLAHTGAHRKLAHIAYPRNLATLAST